MGKRSLSYVSQTEEYDSESFSDTSGYDSESGSEDEEEMIKEALSSAGMKKYFKYFQKKGITSVADAQGLSDKKLSKFVKSSSDRKKILRALEDLDDGSESEYSYDSEDEFLEDVKDISSKYAKALKRAGITTAKKATKPKLKKAGLDSKGIKAVLGIAEGAQLAEALKAKGLKKYVKGLNKAKVLSKSSSGQEKVLKKLGASSGDKKKIMKILSKFSEESDSEEEKEEVSDTVEWVHEVLRKQGLAKYIGNFNRSGVSSLRQARKLHHTEMRKMGVNYYLDREKLIEGFAEYKVRNKKLMNILFECSMMQYAGEFETLISVQDAKLLTHADLKKMGIQLYGDREKLIQTLKNVKLDI
eukprot:augustus_masked-scaffold_23-processed-gene-5.62-mRNA-1 protein AED:1.00 eAED:1.00 QI:0/-1/0/0/-1/1/1/0/357